jgi:SIR2-like domain/TIR domain
MASYLHSVQEESVLQELAKAIRHEHCILLIGLGLALSTLEHVEKLPQRHLKELLHRMTRWCIDKKKFENELIINDFRQLLQDDKLEKVERKLQEYFISPEERHQCINDVMRQGQQQVRSIYQLLCQMPFRAYITTSYDDFLETTYQEVKEVLDLAKVYKASIEEAVAFYQEKQPFVLKLHGDATEDSPEVITLSNRFAHSYLPEAIAYPEQLRTLLANEHTLFLGFEKADPDFEGLKNTVNKRENLKRWFLAPEGHITENEADVLYKEEKIITLSYTDRVELVRFLQKLHAQAANRQQVNVYTSYAGVSQDRRMRKRLQTHLTNIKCQGLEIIWIDGEIGAGQNIKSTLEQRLKSADVILLLISADYLAFTGEGNVEIELARAVQRDRRGEARVIPVILRPCSWKSAPFARLAALPANGTPIELSSKRELVYFQIAESIKAAIEEWAEKH